MDYLPPWPSLMKHRFHPPRTPPLPKYNPGFILIFCLFPHRINTLPRTIHHHWMTQKRSHNFSRFVCTGHQHSHNCYHLRRNFTNHSTFLCHHEISATFQYFIWPCFGGHTPSRVTIMWLPAEQPSTIHGKRIFHYNVCQHSLVHTDLF